MYTYQQGRGCKLCLCAPVEAASMHGITLVLVKTCFITIKIEYTTLPTRLKCITSRDVHVCDWCSCLHQSQPWTSPMTFTAVICGGLLLLEIAGNTTAPFQALQVNCSVVFRLFKIIMYTVLYLALLFYFLKRNILQFFLKIAMIRHDPTWLCAGRTRLHINYLGKVWGK